MYGHCPPVFTLVDMCLPSPHSGLGMRSVPRACRVPGLRRPAVPGLCGSGLVYPQVTSSCCSAPPSSGRCSWLSALRSGSTWPASTPTTWSLCGGSPTPCPTSFTVGGSRGVASLQSPAVGLQGWRARLAPARTEPGAGVADGVGDQTRGGRADMGLAAEGPPGVPLARGCGGRGERPTVTPRPQVLPRHAESRCLPLPLLAGAGGGVHHRGHAHQRLRAGLPAGLLLPAALRHFPAAEGDAHPPRAVGLPHPVQRHCHHLQEHALGESAAGPPAPANTAPEAG